MNEQQRLYKIRNINASLSHLRESLSLMTGISKKATNTIRDLIANLEELRRTLE